MSRRRTSPAVDRISALPDTLLCHILSFLPTKLAVLTSILSNRWYPLWRSLTTLHFIDEKISKPETHSIFKDFVFSVLLLRYNTQPINKFHLKYGRYDSPNDASNIHKWVHFVAKRGLEHLHLDLYSYKSIILPPGIISCKTLIVLKLSSVEVNALPCDVYFPSLKILHLDWVSFNEHRCLMKLLNGCPILEDLKTGHLLVLDEHHNEGEVESLTKLVKADISNKSIPLTLLHNVGFLRAKLKGSYYLNVCEFRNLTRMEIIFKPYNWHWLVGVMRLCPQLQILFIEKGFISDKKKMNQVYNEDWEDPQIVPECLSSQLRTCTLSNYAGLECELQFARYVMQSSKSLLTMTICSTSSLSKEEKLQSEMKLSLCPKSSATCKLIYE